VYDDPPHPTYVDPPPPMVQAVCSRCGFAGGMTVRQSAPGYHASEAGPAEPPTFSSMCPRCHTEEVLDD